MNYGENNPAYKNSQKYEAVHAWVRRRLVKPEFCEHCKSKPPVDIANKSGQYLKDLSDWEYLCRKCHMDSDGRNEQLRLSGKSRKLPDKTCPVCLTVFHPKYSEQVACNSSCRSILIWQKREKVRAKECVVCFTSYTPKSKDQLCCSSSCGRKLSWKKRKEITQ